MEQLPEIMKVNRRLEAAPCVCCSIPLTLGEDVHNCPSCGLPSHQRCWNRTCGCGNPGCGYRIPLPTDPLADLIQSIPPSSARPRGSSPMHPSSVSPRRGGKAGNNAQKDSLDSLTDESPGGETFCMYCGEPLSHGAKICPACLDRRVPSAPKTATPVYASSSPQTPLVLQIYGTLLMAVFGLIFLVALLQYITLDGRFYSYQANELFFTLLISSAGALIGLGVSRGNPIALTLYALAGLPFLIAGVVALFFSPPAGIAILFVVALIFAPPLLSTTSNSS